MQNTVITPYHAMSNRQMPPAISLQSNSLLEFVFSWNKMNWKLLWRCLSCWGKRTACNASITPLFCTIFVNLKERSALKEYTNNTLSILKRDMSAFSDWPHRCTTHIWMCTSRLKDVFYHIWHFFLSFEIHKIKSADHDIWVHNKPESWSMFVILLPKRLWLHP